MTDVRTPTVTPIIPLTPEELAEWERLERERTAGEWESSDGTLLSAGVNHEVYTAFGSYWTRDLLRRDEFVNRERDPDYVAACTRFTARAIAELRTQAQRIVELQRTIEGITICPDCGGSGELGPERGGQRVACETCGGHEDAPGRGFIVPELGAQSEEEAKP